MQEEWDAVRRTQYFMKYETGYQKIQGTKPQTLGRTTPDPADGAIRPLPSTKDHPMGPDEDRS